MIYDDLSQIEPGAYNVIAADPPWTFRTYSAKGKGRSAERHYGVMTIDDIAAMTVGDLAAPDCALLLWGTSPLLPEALTVMEPWGFTFKGKAFCWAKTNTRQNFGVASSPRTWFMGMGYNTRSNTEDCWLGTRGKPKRLSAGVRELIVAPPREHSRKPDQFYRRADELYGGRKLDLFSRQERDGWDAFGNEVGKFG